MANHPFLKSIRPVNLLSFGPNTEEIELRPLNILIGPNGSGKSNLIEIVGLLQSLTEKKPWTHVTESGGVQEWVWKSVKNDRPLAPLVASLRVVVSALYATRKKAQRGEFTYRLELDARPWSTTFTVRHESVLPHPEPPGDLKSIAEVWRDKAETILRNEEPNGNGVAVSSLETTDQISALSVASGFFGAFSQIAREFSRIKLYREWAFGARSTPRSLEQAGRETTYLEEDNSNLAHILNSILTHQDPEPAQKLREAFGKFSGDAKDIETRIQEGFVQLRIRENTGISIPAIRLSDGTLRWLALLAILFNPTPPPITCIEEPELGLHPDIIPALSDLLRDASTRTQLIVTTHSRTLVECFSDQPESVCVCEKHDGATEIERLDKDRLKVWLDKYSLGQLWSSGQIGGNRW